MSPFDLNRFATLLGNICMSGIAATAATDWICTFYLRPLLRWVMP